MRVNPTISVLRVLALLIGLSGFACAAAVAGAAAGEPRPPVAIQFSLDRPVNAGAAPFVVAASRGLFGAEGLAVTTDVADGSPEAIARVAAGASDLALVDINELIRFRGKSDAPPIKAVFVLFNKSPYAIIARKSRGIHALSDIEGKTLGVVDGDLSIRLWPALARQNGIKTVNVKLNRISVAVREPMLSAGQVDAVAGFSYLSAVNLSDRGVPADDLAVLRYADYGCEAYGSAVIVNPAFAAAKPEAVKGFLRAAVAGTLIAIKEPVRTSEEVAGRIDGGSREMELARLRIVISDNIVTGEVKRNGIGGIDPAFAAAKPEAVKGFLRAVIAGTRLAIKDPAQAVDEVLTLMEGGSRDLELARLRAVIADNILTDEVKRNGIGGIDPARLDRSIDQIAEDFKFQKRPSPPDIFDDSFLPAVNRRLVSQAEN